MEIFQMQVEFVFTGIGPIAVKLQTGKFVLEKVNIKFTNFGLI
jgi:hypothetical protein